MSNNNQTEASVKSVVPRYQLGSCYGRVAACDISLGRRTRIKYKNVAITKRSRPCGAIKNSANELGTSNRQNCARLIFSYIVYFRSQKADILIFFPYSREQTAVLIYDSKNTLFFSINVEYFSLYVRPELCEYIWQ